MGEQELKQKVKEWSDRVNADLDAGICPVCKQPNIEAKRDGRQGGATQVLGEWVNFHCAKCGYRLDAVRPIIKARA